MCAEKVDAFDAVIVGSGISGALIAKILGQANKRVLILEAGEKLPPDINGYMHRFLMAADKVPESPYPPEIFQSDGVHFTDPGTINAGRPNSLTLQPGNWNDPKQAYLVQKGPLAFASTYERINGGTVRHWLGTSLRLVPGDFEMKSRYGRFVDWPIKYADLEPWYAAAEREIGVSADVKDQEYLGLTFSSPYPMPRIPLSRVDMAVSAAMAGLQIKGIGLDDLKWEVSSTPAGRNSQPYQDRRVCAGNTNCIPICPIQAKYDPSVTLAAALRTGNVTVRYRTVASKVLVDENGRVNGIDYIQYERDNGPITGRGRATGKIYILAAHAIENPRLLLMSTSERTPNGVANSVPNNAPNGPKFKQGVIGKNLMDHPLYLAWALAKDPVWGYRGPLATAGIEVCRDGTFRRDRGAFRIEIGNEGWSFSSLDPATTTIDFVAGSNWGLLNPGSKPVFGTDLVKALNDKLTRQFRLGFLVEQGPEERNKVTLAANAKDNLGLPRPEITYDLDDYAKDAIAAAATTATAIYEKMGATEYTNKGAPVSDKDPTSFEWPVGPGGTKRRFKYYGAGHIVGTHSMGTSKDNSAVNDKQQSWLHDNLFLVGSGSFPTVATANPTLTIAALCLRTADHIVRNVLR